MGVHKYSTQNDKRDKIRRLLPKWGDQTEAKLPQRMLSRIKCYLYTKVPYIWFASSSLRSKKLGFASSSLRVPFEFASSENSDFPKIIFQAPLD